MKPAAASLRTYFLTWLGLLGLTIATALIGRLSLGHFNIMVAVAIAAVQAFLVAGVFMRALFEGKLVLISIAAGVVWLLIFSTFTTTDYFTRGWVPFPGK